MNQKILAEQKFRPLKKQMQQTFKRIRQAVRANTLPEQRDIDEFISQIKMMVSYPGFGDRAYPAFVAAGKALADFSAKHDLDGARQTLADILAQQSRCHDGLEQSQRRGLPLAPVTE